MTNYYVDQKSSSASDSNNGLSVTSPVKTIQKAANLAQPGDVIFIREGTYRETVRPANSGTATAPITFKQYEEEKVIISGLEIISSEWTVHQGSIWKTQIPSEWNLGITKSQVFVNSKAMTPAIWPKSDKPIEERYITDFAMSSAGSCDPTPIDSAGNCLGTYEDPHLAPIWKDAYISFLPGSAWGFLLGQVTNSEKGKIDFSFKYNSFNDAYNPVAGNYYFLWGKLECLSQEGEYLVDANSLVYLWPPRSSIDNQLIEIKVRDNGFSLKDRHYITIEGIDFVGCCIYSNSSNGINLIDCSFSYGQYDLMNSTEVIRLQGNQNEVKNCLVAHCAGKPIQMIGEEIKLINSVFCHTLKGSGLTINCKNSVSKIENNTFFNTASHGLSLNCKQSQVLRNWIFNIGNRTIDIAGINLAGTGDMNRLEIAYNLTHDHNSLFDSSKMYWGASGIRLDSGFPEGVSNVLVHHNIVFNSTNSSITIFPLAQTQTNYGNSGNKIFNNTCQGQIRSPYRINYSMKGTVIQNNIASQYNASGDPAIIPDGLTLTNNILACSSFPNNLNVEPQLVNSNNFDYRLRSDSPAINAGVVIDNFTPFNGTAPDIGALQYGDKPLIAGAYIWKASQLSDLYFQQESPSKLVISGLPLGRGFPSNAVFKVAGVANSYHYNTVNTATNEISTVVIFPDFPSSAGVYPVEIYLDGVNSNGSWAAFNVVSLREPTIEAVDLAIAKLNDTTTRYSFTIKGNGFAGEKLSKIPLKATGNYLPAHSIVNSSPQISSFSEKPFLCQLTTTDVTKLLSEGIISSEKIGINPVDHNGNTLNYWLDGVVDYGLLWLKHSPVKFATFQKYEEPSSVYLELSPDLAEQSSLADVFPAFASFDLKTWLKANDIAAQDNQNIDSWTTVAQTGVFRQTSPDRQPKFKHNQIGGLPGLQFDGAKNHLAGGDIFSKHNTTGTFIVVYSSNNPNSLPWQRLISTSAPSSKDYEIGFKFVCASDSAGLPLAQPKGGLSISSSSATADLSNAHIGIRHSNLGNAFNGCIHEIMMLAGTIKAKDLKPITDEYLRVKYDMLSTPTFKASLDWDGLQPPFKVEVNHQPCQVENISLTEVKAFIDLPSNAAPTSFELITTNFNGAIATTKIPGQ